MGEVEIAAFLCAFLAGSSVEDSHGFENLGRTRHIRGDCETATHVIEVGLDGKASSRDSVHQALFASIQTGKVPMVVIIDRDGEEGRYEYEIRAVAERAGVLFVSCSEDFVVRWKMTQAFRRPDVGAQGDLPKAAVVQQRCDLGKALTRNLGALISN